MAAKAASPEAALSNDILTVLKQVKPAPRVAFLRYKGRRCAEC